MRPRGTAPAAIPFAPLRPAAHRPASPAGGPPARLSPCLSPRRIAGLAACLFVCLVAVPGCSDDASRPADTCVAPPGACTSPEAALLALQEAYNTRVPAALDSLLDGDFSFELSPEDAGQPGMPDSWGRSSELSIHTRMMNADSTLTLLLDFVIGPRVFDPAAQLWTITITEVGLYLHGITPHHPTPTTYRIEDGVGKFWFRPTAWSAPCSAESAWKIVKWQDMPVPEAAHRGQALPGSGTTTTWGSIKSLYFR